MADVSRSAGQVYRQLWEPASRRSRSVSEGIASGSIVSQRGAASYRSGREQEGHQEVVTLRVWTVGNRTELARVMEK